MKATDVDIKDYLLKIGCKPVTESNAYTKYFSPFRNESEPSFMVRNSDQRWSDCGYSPLHLDQSRRDKKWHGVLDLAMEVNACSAKEAANILLDGKYSTAEKTSVVDRPPSIEIVSEKDLTNRFLVRYLKSRRIDIDIARMYCRQVEVRFHKHPDKTFSYIGFKNDKGAWELRSKNMKIGNSPKYYTKILGDQSKLTKNTNVFEGFIDFLSALTYWRVSGLKNSTFILNSLVNMSYITGYLDRSDKNYMFLDNDNAADEKLEWLMKEGVVVDDMRHIYSAHNDFNDFLCGKLSL